MAGVAPGLTRFAPSASAWLPNVFIAQYQLVYNAGTLYVANTGHISRATFDGTEAAMFTAVVAGGGGSLAVTSVAAMGTTPVIAQGGVTTLIWDGILSANASLDFSGWPAAGTYGEVLVRVHQAASAKTLAIPGVDLWNNTYAPAMPTVADGVLEFTAFTIDGGTTVVGVHGQPIRKYNFKIAVPADGVVAKSPQYFDFDARIVAVRPSTGGTPVSTAAVFDLLKGSGNGSASTIYTTTGNRPSVTAGNLTNTATALPDTTTIAPNSYLQAKTVTASSSTDAVITVTTVEAG